MLCAKYNPNNIDEVKFNKNSIQKVLNMSNDMSIPHMIFFGPEGCGKKTIIKLFLEKLYGPKINNLKSVDYSFTGSSNIIQKIKIMQSDYHIIIEPNNINSDKYLVQDVIKEYTKRKNIIKSSVQFRTIYINNIDNMSYYAQTSLRRTIEKYSDSYRFIMWSRSLSKIIPPLLSRCYCFPVPSPSNKEIIKYIMEISIKENIHFDLDKLCKIINISNNNIKKILWLLELTSLDISYETSYDETISELVDLIFKNNIESFMQIRKKVYAVMITNIIGNKIIKDLMNNIIVKKELSNNQIIQIVKLASKADYRFIKGRHNIMHIEIFISGIKKIIFCE